MSKSLKKDVGSFLRQKKLPKVFETDFQRNKRKLKYALSDKHKGLFVIPIVISFFVIGQYFKPSFLQIFYIDPLTAFTIVDQRTSNMATIFSISLVVIGWLITNLSVKESISYELMFRRIYLYPTFYFVATIIGTLIFISLFRNTTLFNVGDAIVSGSYLIIGAIVAIVSLFRRLIKVIDDNYFFESLEREVLREVYALNYKTIYTAYGQKLYTDSINKMGISQGATSFFAKENNHIKIPIKAFVDSKQKNDGDPLDIFLNEENISVNDINIDRILKVLSSKKMASKNYYKSLGIFEVVSSNCYIFEFHNDEKITEKEIKKIQSAFKTKTHKNNTDESTNYTDYLNTRIVNEVKIGKKKNVDAMLRTMRKVYEMDDAIKNNL